MHKTLTRMHMHNMVKIDTKGFQFVEVGGGGLSMPPPPDR